LCKRDAVKKMNKICALNTRIFLGFERLIAAAH